MPNAEAGVFYQNAGLSYWLVLVFAAVGISVARSAATTCTPNLVSYYVLAL